MSTRLDKGPGLFSLPAELGKMSATPAALPTMQVGELAARDTVPWEVGAATAENLVQGLFRSE